MTTFRTSSNLALNPRIEAILFSPIPFYTYLFEVS